MDVNPGPSHPAELVVHVVFLVQEELQHQAMVRTCHCHLPHLQMRQYFISELVSLKYLPLCQRLLS